MRLIGSFVFASVLLAGCFPHEKHHVSPAVAVNVAATLAGGALMADAQSDCEPVGEGDLDHLASDACNVGHPGAWLGGLMLIGAVGGFAQSLHVALQPDPEW